MLDVWKAFKPRALDPCFNADFAAGAAPVSLSTVRNSLHIKLCRRRSNISMPSSALLDRRLSPTTPYCRAPTSPVATTATA